MIDFYKARNVLAALWGTFGILLFLLFFLQTLGERFGTRDEEAWAWFLPSIMPTLMLIVGVYAGDAFRVRTQMKVRGATFLVALLTSLFYLVVLSVVIVIPAFWGRTFFELIGPTAYFMGPLQGLSVAVLAVFFTQAQKDE